MFNIVNDLNSQMLKKLRLGLCTTQMSETIANDSNTRHGRSYLGSLALWTLFTILGGPVFYFLAITLFLMQGIPIDYDGSPLSATWVFAVLGIFGGAIAGVIVGLGQWLSIRSQSISAGRWVAASLFGWAIGGAIYMSLMWIMGDIQVQVLGQTIGISFLIASISAGAGIGLGQWSLLRRWITGRWVAVTTLAWASGWVVSYIVAGILYLVFNVGERGSSAAILSLLILWVLVGTIAGVITRAEIKRQLGL
jgi:hypothetical protein